MKIHIDLPWGGSFHFEREKADPELVVLALFIISLFSLIAFIFR